MISHKNGVVNYNVIGETQHWFYINPSLEPPPNYHLTTCVGLSMGLLDPSLLEPTELETPPPDSF